MITEVVKQKGLEHITVDDLVAEITPKGRGQYLIKQSSATDTMYYQAREHISLSIRPLGTLRYKYFFLSQEFSIP